MSTENKTDHGPLKLDTVTLETYFSTYPEELREPCLWLGTYVRTDCAGDLDVLTSRAGDLSINLDKTTWGRILRGKLNRNKAGETTPNLLVNQAKLAKAIKSIRDDARLREKAGRVPFVNTEITETVWNFVDTRRASERVNKIGIIVGHTGTQKTASLKEYCREHNHGTCVHTDAPATPSLSQFVSDLAYRYGGCRTSSHNVQLQTIWKSVNSRKTIVLENTQRLYSERHGSNQPVFNFLQKLQEETGCTLILTITPVFEKILLEGVAAGFFEQFIGRAGGIKEFLRLPKYASQEDVLAIATAFNLQAAERHADYLVKISREPGLIRILFEALQKAKVAAELAGEKLTINHIRAARGED